MEVGCNSLVLCFAKKREDWRTMSSDTSDCKESNNAREGGTANDGKYHPPKPESHGTTVAARTTTLATRATKEAGSNKVRED